MFIYGMRNRPAGPGCQPEDFVDFKECRGKYYNYLYYDRLLTNKEKSDFELDFIGISAGDCTATNEVTLEDHLSDDAFERFCMLFDVKYPLESHSFGSSIMELIRGNGMIHLKGLPWNCPMCDPIRNYLTALMNFAAAAKRVNHHKESNGSEKYAFRLWLNRIGLSGPDYKETRKVLLANLSGSATRAHE